MPIEYAPAPAPAIQTLNEVLPQILQTPSLGEHLPSLADGLQRAIPPSAGRPSIKPILSAPLHVIGLNDVVRGSDLSRNAPTAWTHVLSSDHSMKEPMVAADTSAETSTFETLRQGPSGRDFHRYLEDLSNAPDVASDNYKLAVLRVPALHIECLWLQSKTNHEDIVVPITKHNDLVKAGHRYKMQDFLKAIKPAAEEVLRQDGDGKGG